MSDGFRAGFASRHDDAAAALGAAFGLSRAFEPRCPSGTRADRRPAERAPAPAKSFTPQEAGPRHFVPRDPDHDPTEGWDPFDVESGTPEGSGFVDPVAAAHAAGYAEGVAATLAQHAAEAGRNTAFAEALGLALGKGPSFDRERVARQLRQTVMLLVGRLVGEAGVSGELLAGRVEAAIDCLADCAESAMLRVHPDDVALLDGRLPKTLFPVGDASIARGSFVLESASTIVEDGPDQWLEQLTAALDKVAMPQC